MSTGTAHEHHTSEAQISRVSTLELFFDLVFVLTVTQLTKFVVEEPTAEGVLRAALLLSVIFYMYGGYAWLTNAVAADRLARRVTLLGGMAAFLVVAFAIPYAYDDGRGYAFGLAYLVVVLIHAVLFARSARLTDPRAIFDMTWVNLLGAALVIIATATGGHTTTLFLGLATLVLWGMSWLRSARGGFDIGSEHFVERHGLVVIVAIGESLVAMGEGAEGLGLSPELLGTAVLGLLLSAALWWCYFGGDDERAVDALEGVPAQDRGIVALVAFGYWHVLMLFGIVLLSAGLKKALAHPLDGATTAAAIFLAAGVALFLLGEALFRRTLGIGRSATRIAAAAVALIAISIGTEVAAIAAVAVLLAVLLGLFAVEAATPRPARPRAGR